MESHRLIDCAHSNTLVYFSSFRITHTPLIGIELNLWIHLETVAVVTQLSLLIHDHGTPFHLCRSSLSVSRVLRFSVRGSCTYFVKFISKYFIFLNAVISYVVF